MREFFETMAKGGEELIAKTRQATTTNAEGAKKANIAVVKTKVVGNGDENVWRRAGAGFFKTR